MTLTDLFSPALDPSRIIEANDAQERYGATTTGAEKRLSGALHPLNTGEIQQIVSIARTAGLKLYPISAGRNWGYSDSMPRRDDRIILDLSGMKAIHDYDPELGTITVEPGVTQKMLCEYLQEHGNHHIISVTGSSPEASIIGNYLERGFGLTPVMDHALAVMNLRAVLGDGSIYESPFLAYGGNQSAKVFRWGYGPYTDGLFFQSSFGAVTSMTIKLARPVENTYLCLSEIKDAQNLAASITALRNLRENWAIETMQIKVINDYYGMASAGLRRSDIEKAGSIEAARKKFNTCPYTVIVTLGGPESLTALVSRHIKQQLKPYGRIKILNTPILKIIRRLTPLFPPSLKLKAKALDQFHSLLKGVPGTLAVGKLPYFCTGNDDGLDKTNPAKDRRGIIWFALVLPFRAESYFDFEKICYEASEPYGIAPVLNLTNYGQSSSIGLMAIIFDQQTQSETAQNCYLDLINKAIEKGYFPYRIPAFAVNEIAARGIENRFANKIKALLDPEKVWG